LPANAATESTLSALNNKVTSISGRVQTDIAATTLPLPTGASTSSLQTTGNTSLSNIDTKLPTGLTVTSNKLQTDSTVSGTVAISNQISGFSTETTLNTLNNKLTSTAGRLQTDANITGAVEIANDVGNPIPVNGTLAISNQITGFATAANQTTEITSLQNIDGKLPAIVNNSVRTSIIPLSLTGNGLPATVVNFDLFNISFGDFSSISIQIIGTFVATLAVQISDNNIDFVTVSCRSMTASGNSNTTVQTITVPGIYALNRSAKFIKLRTTAYTSGTVNAVYELNSLPILDDAKNIFIGGSVTVDTELAAAAALADGISGTLLTSTAGAANLVYNGTTFDRQRTMSAIANSEGLGRIKTSGNSQVFTLASVTGNTTTTVVALGTPFNNLYCQLIYPVGITDFEATIDGSLNGTDWYDLCTIPRIANGTKPATGTIFNALDNSFSATRLASFNNLRVRITNFTGTGTLVILASASENALSRPIATIQKIQEGSNIFNLATNANTITVNPVIDLSIPYNILYAQIILNGSITALEFTVEGSLNGTNWEIIRNYSNSNSGTIFEPHTPPLTSGNIINLTDGKPNYFGTSYLGGNYSDVIFRYLRLNINSITGSGTVTVIGACQTNQTKLSASVSENLRNLPIIGNSIENLTTIVNGLLFQKIFFTKEIRHSTIGVTPVSIAANTVTQLNDLTNSRDYALISNKTNTRIYLGFSDVSSTKYIDFIEANSTYKLTWALNPNVPPYAFSTVNSQILISNFVRDVSNF
jgi:hypothetical protein